MTQQFAIFCNPESRRAEFFCTALGRQIRQKPIFIPWQWVLEGGSWFEKVAFPPDFLRIESPGRNWSVETLLLARGALVQDEEAEKGWNRIDQQCVAALRNEPGRVLPMRQGFLGWREVLRDLERWRQGSGIPSRWMSPPGDIERMYDKAACGEMLGRAGIKVPPSLGIPRSCYETLEAMRAERIPRAFLKPCHGSSGSGVVAIEINGAGIQAFSTIEIVEDSSKLRMYNSRRINRYQGAAEVRRVLDAVCKERCLLQAWIPKAGISGRPFDLRVVVIGGRARHVMVRLGRGPITNSQLLGGRGEPAEVRRRMGENAWGEMLQQAERVMAECFPESLYAGLDVLVEPNFRTTWILEVNAFGDLLPRLLLEGKDTYQWELEAALAQKNHQVSATGA